MAVVAGVLGLLGHHRRPRAGRLVGAAAHRGAPCRAAMRETRSVARMSGVLVTGGDGFLGRGRGARRWPRAGHRGGRADVRAVPAERRAAGRDLRACRTCATPPLVDTLRRARASTPWCTSPRSSRRARDSTASSSTRSTSAAAATCSRPAWRTACGSWWCRSSGAAYGYHADNPAWLTETDPLRGNEVFAYCAPQAPGRGDAGRATARAPRSSSRRCCASAPSSGEPVDNQITALFEKPRLLGDPRQRQPLRLHLGRGRDRRSSCTRCARGRAGIFNVAGDGALTIHEIAAAARQAGARAARPRCCAPRSRVGSALRHQPLRARAARLPALPAGARQHPR